MSPSVSRSASWNARRLPSGEKDQTIDCDDVLVAVGQENAFPWIERDCGVDFDKWNMPVVDPATLYRIGPDGRIYNQFRYRIANRGSKPGAVVFTIQHLPGASLAMASNPVKVQPGESVQGEFEISRPAGRREELVSHFTILTNTVPDQEADAIPMTFLAPAESK